MECEACWRPWYCAGGNKAAPGCAKATPPPPAPHEAYAALRTALIGSGVLTEAQAEQWARRIVDEMRGEQP